MAEDERGLVGPNDRTLAEPPPLPSGRPGQRVMVEDAFTELGTTGLMRTQGIVHEEFLPELMGERGRRVYRQMIDNDPIIGASLGIIEWLVRKVEWTVEPVTDSPVDMGYAEFLRQCLLEDMSAAWQDTLSEIISFIPWGWSYLETTFKYRDGPLEADPSRRSKFTDGKVGLRKLSIRGQETLLTWDFDPEGGIKGLNQWGAPDFVTHYIPIEKALLFRTTSRKNNPEGKPALRNVYEPWYYGREIMRIEAVGVERDLAGLPIGWVPPRYLENDLTPPEQAVRNALEKLIVNIRRDAQEGALFPLKYDDHGNKLFDLTLMTSGGSRQFDTDKIIARYDHRKAIVFMTDFMLLGTTATGSYALSEDKTDLFEVALDVFLNIVCDVINRHLVPRLFGMNGVVLPDFPKLAHGKIKTIPLDVLGQFILRLSQAGHSMFPSPDGQIEHAVTERAGLPAVAPEQYVAQAAEQAAAEQAQADRELALRQQQIDARAAAPGGGPGGAGGGLPGGPPRPASEPPRVDEDLDWESRRAAEQAELVSALENVAARPVVVTINQPPPEPVAPRPPRSLQRTVERDEDGRILRVTETEVEEE